MLIQDIDRRMGETLSKRHTWVTTQQYAHMLTHPIRHVFTFFSYINIVYVSTLLIFYSSFPNFITCVAIKHRGMEMREYFRHNVYSTLINCDWHDITWRPNIHLNKRHLHMLIKFASDRQKDGYWQAIIDIVVSQENTTHLPQMTSLPQ